MKKEVLPNGLTILYEPKKGNSVVVEVMIKVGSSNELPEERGISHFLEHMFFEGTKKRPSNRQISNEIEKIGGDLNAYTSNERTCFYAKVLKKHFNIAIDILADILQNSLFETALVEKERKVILKEVDMIYDEPRFYQWELLQSTLFEKNPVKNPVYGDKIIIKKLSRSNLVNYMNKHYQPENMIISVVGDVKNWKKAIKDKFPLPKGKIVKQHITKEPASKKNKEKRVKRDIASTYAVLGFKTIPRDHKDSYVLEIIDGILGRGQSGKIFTEVRTNHGLAYDVGTQHISDTSYGYFAVYVSTDKTNLIKSKNLILKEMEKLQNVSKKDLEEAKTYVEGQSLLDLEDNQKVADQLLFWEQVKTAQLMDDFVKNTNKVTLEDVKRVAKKYFKNHTFVVLEGK
jgi:predicted Zn-dependent peptidase